MGTSLPAPVSLTSDATSNPITYNMTLLVTTDYTSEGIDYLYTDECTSLHCVYELRYREDQRINLLCIAIILSVLGGVGLAGNLLVLIVLLRTKVKQTSIYLMCMLAVVDLIACTIVIPGIIANEWHFKFYNDFFCKFWEFLRYFTIPTSAMILVAIALDRFYIICFSPRRFGKRSTAAIIAAIVLLGTGCGVPPVLGMGVYAQYGDDKVYVAYCISNYMYITIDDLVIYWYVITAIFLFMIVSIVSLYSSIFVFVLKQNQKWNKINPLQLSSAAEMTQSHEEKVRRESEQSRRQANDKIFNTRASQDLIKVPHNPSTAWKLEPPTKVCPLGYNNKPSTSSDPPPENDLDIPPKRSADTFTDLQLPGSTSKPTIIHIKERASCTEDQISVVPRTSVSFLEDVTVSKDTSNKPTTSLAQKKRVQINDRRRSSTAKKPTSTKPAARRIHIKTTQVLFTVTIVYIISFLPTFLMSYNLIKLQKVVYLIYFFNNTANPIIYSFMNPKFRQEVKKLFGCIKKCRK
ncbi:hypothetical protein FSP39_009286 [Pinctada imbricata]|uniref:G-protein coupled receptors family 1 profile domain-containing protein n=1 Tax=Pinctada imbricata TaxID=66713 RepID=A0AA88XEY3_PINIB|nr:hypothetical protein FSP39_009286 [Pinctada imbricata]